MMIPPRVNHYDYWTEKPPQPSPRLQYWLDRIAAGWRKKGRIRRMGYDEAAEWFGVYLWEYLNVLFPLLHNRDTPLVVEKPQ